MRVSLHILIFLSWALLLSGCGGSGVGDEAVGVEPYRADVVVKAFAESGVPVQVGLSADPRDEGAIIRAVLDPVEPRFRDSFSVDVLRSSGDVENVKKSLLASGREQHTLSRSNVLVFYGPDVPSSLKSALEEALSRLPATQTRGDGPGSPASSDSQNLDVRPVPPDRACPGGRTEPIQVEELIRVFRQHGLEMFDDPECLHTRTERQASNAPKFGPDARRGDAFDDVMRTQGWIACDLLAYPINPLRPVEKIRYEGDEETEFRFGNVRCIIYPGDALELEQVERLRRAASELARVVAEDE